MRGLTVVALIGVLIWAWMWRLDAKLVQAPNYVLITDRWKGTVYICDYEACSHVYPQ
jgi:hypothetical protein